jgi:hypothetical protein
MPRYKADLGAASFCLLIVPFSISQAFPTLFYEVPKNKQPAGKAGGLLMFSTRG